MSENRSVSPEVLAALPEALTWPGRPQESDLAGAPGTPAVYLLVATRDLPVQLATTQHLRRLLLSRLTDPTRVQHGKADLAEVVRGVRWRAVQSAFEGRWWYYRLAREMYPKRYRSMISFGPAFFLRVDWAERIPDISITKQVWQASGEMVGPWLTHDTCQKALDGLRDLFDLCRYPEQVQRAPGGQRCLYAEMGRCDAPCDGSVPLARYLERVQGAWKFARGGVREWAAAAKERMTCAAREQRFEQAALLKRQIAWAWKWYDHVLPLVRPVDELNYLLAVPVHRRRAWRLFLFWRGDLAEGSVLSDRKLPQEAGPWLAGLLADPPRPAEAQVRMEQTWLVAHFLRSRAGDASIPILLPRAEAPAELADVLRASIERRRARRGGHDEGAVDAGTAPSAAQTVNEDKTTEQSQSGRGGNFASDSELT
jgi:excinuclease UvrABC nuclease subunit